MSNRVPKTLYDRISRTLTMLQPCGMKDAIISARLGSLRTFLLVQESSGFGTRKCRHLVVLESAGYGIAEGWVLEQIAHFQNWRLRDHKTARLGILSLP